MTTLKAHFDGQRIVLDEPLPPGLPPNTPVSVVIDERLVEGTPPHPEDKSVLERLAELAVHDDALPRDFAEQHDHYVKGTPRR